MNKITIYNIFQAFLLLVILSVMGCKKKDNVELSKAFVKYYGGIKSDAAVEVLQTSDGGYVIAGTSNMGTGNADNYDMIIIKTDAEGNELWHKTFGGDFYDECGSVAIMPDNGYIMIGTYGKTSRKWSITGLELTKDSTEMVAVRLDANGNTLWEIPYNYSNPSVAVGTFGKAVVVNPNGTCFLGGMVDSTYIDLVSGDLFLNIDLFGVLINPDGSLVQVGGVDTKPLRYGADDQPDYMYGVVKAFSTIGDEYLISSTTVLNGESTPRLVKCRLNGIRITQNNAPSKSGWAPTYPEANNLFNAAQVCYTSDNNYMMTGVYGTSLVDSDIYMFKLSGLSVVGMSPVKVFGSSGGSDIGNSIISTNDAGYAILGTTNNILYTQNAEKLNDVVLIKTDNNGTQQWVKTFGGNGDDYATKVIQTSDGGYLICGTISFGEDVSNSGASNSITLIKLDSEGELSNLK